MLITFGTQNPMEFLHQTSINVQFSSVRYALKTWGSQRLWACSKRWVLGHTETGRGGRAQMSREAVADDRSCDVVKLRLPSSVAVLNTSCRSPNNSRHATD